MTESFELLNNQAISFASHGEYSEAIECVKQALQFERDNHLLWFNLGVTYRDSGDFDNARFALEKAFHLSRENGESGEDEAEVLSQMLFTSGNLEEAFEYCTIGLNINPLNAHIWNNLGVVLFNMQSYELAESAFEHAITINPYYYDALFNLRDTYDELGNADGRLVCELKMKEINRKDI